MNFSIPDPSVPNFRFCVYFNETKERCKNKIAGQWIKSLDNDTLNEIISIAKKIDANPLLLDNDEEIWKDFVDLTKMAVLLVEWETNKPFIVVDEFGKNDLDAVDKQTEYVFRLTALMQFEYNRRNKIKNLVLSKDNRKYKGKLSIYE